MKLNFRSTDGSSSATPVLPPPSIIPPRRLFHSSSAAPHIPPSVPRAPHEDSQNDNEDDTSVAPQSPSPVIHAAQQQVPLSPSYSTTETPLPILNHDPSPVLFSQLPSQLQPQQTYPRSSREEQSRRPLRHTSQPRRGRSAPRGAGLTLRKVSLYALGLFLVLATPFILPVAISHTVRLARASSNMLPVEIRLTERAKHSLFQAWSEALDALNFSPSNRKTWSPSIVWAGSTTATTSSQDSSPRINATEHSHDIKLNSSDLDQQSDRGLAHSPKITESSTEFNLHNHVRERAVHELHENPSQSSVNPVYSDPMLGLHSTGISYGQDMNSMEALGHSWGHRDPQSSQYGVTPSTSTLYGHSVIAAPIHRGVSNEDIPGIIAAQQQMERFAAANGPQGMHNSYGVSDMHANVINPPAAPLSMEMPSQHFDQTAFQNTYGGSHPKSLIENSGDYANGVNTHTNQDYMRRSSSIPLGKEVVQRSQAQKTVHEANDFRSGLSKKNFHREQIEGIDTDRLRKSAVDGNEIGGSSNSVRDTLEFRAIPFEGSKELRSYRVEEGSAVRNIRDADAVKKRIANADMHGEIEAKGVEAKFVGDISDAHEMKNRLRSPQEEPEIVNFESNSVYRYEKPRTESGGRDILGTSKTIENGRNTASLSTGPPTKEVSERDQDEHKKDISVGGRRKIVRDENQRFPSGEKNTRIEKSDDKKGNDRETKGIGEVPSQAVKQQDLRFDQQIQQAEIGDKGDRDEVVMRRQEKMPEKQNLQGDEMISTKKSGEYERASHGNSRLSDSYQKLGKITKSSFVKNENNRVASVAVRNEVIEGNARHWEKYAVVSDGKLQLARTMERRLTQEVGPRMNKRLLERMVGRMEGCSEMTLDSVSLDTERGVPAIVEVTTGCGHGLTCVAHTDVSDLHRLALEVEGSGGGYLLASETQGSARKTWGPLQGPLRVTIADDGVAILGGSCKRNDGDPLSWTKSASIGDIKRTLREIGHMKGRPVNWDEVFTYDVQPRRHTAERS